MTELVVFVNESMFMYSGQQENKNQRSLIIC